MMAVRHFDFYRTKDSNNQDPVGWFLMLPLHARLAGVAREGDALYAVALVDEERPVVKCPVIIAALSQRFAVPFGRRVGEHIGNATVPMPGGGARFLTIWQDLPWPKSVLEGTDPVGGPQ